jgi:predicted membrane metal-binding protein
MFAGSMGAWAITSPANYAVNAGWVGMVSYALSCGAPIVIVAFLGDRVQRIWPEASSLSDFVGRRRAPSPPHPTTFPPCRRTRTHQPPC